MSELRDQHRAFAEWFLQQNPVAPNAEDLAWAAWKAALAQLEAEPPRDEWRPASEPPEDGRRVLIWVAKSGGETFRPAYCPAGGWTSVFDGETLVAWRDINPPTEGAE